MANGNYVVFSSGARTWCDGTTGRIGSITATNSIIDYDLGTVLPLKDGNYVISSPNWKSGRGAVTWCDGKIITSGKISAENSVVGATIGDRIGSGGITVLANGNFVIGSLSTPWPEQVASYARETITLVNGTGPTAGVVTSSNSLISTLTRLPNGQFPSSEIVALANGNYVIYKQNWGGGSSPYTPAAVWGNGETGAVGTVSISNSLIGFGSQLPSRSLFTVKVYPDGNYTVISPDYDPGSEVDKSSISLGNGSTGTYGYITSCNSVITPRRTTYQQVYAYNSTYGYLLVGSLTENRLTIFDPNHTGLTLATKQDSVITNVAGTDAVDLLADSGCRIVAKLSPNGSDPVAGQVEAKVWIEPAVSTVYGQPFVSRHYQITPSNNASTASGRVTLYFTQHDFDTFNDHSGSTKNLPANETDASGKSNLKLSKYGGQSDDNSGLPESYTDGSVIIDPDDSDIVWNSTQNRWEISFNTIGFSGFFVHTSPSPFPVRLISFSGVRQERQAILDWRIADPEYFSHFEVQRSADAKNFQTIGRVDLAESIDRYQFVHVNAMAFANSQNTVTYRLKLVDQDSSFALSKIIVIHCNNTFQNNAFPNPFDRKISISVDAAPDQDVEVQLIDLKGQPQLKRTVKVRNNLLEIEKIDIPPGTYVLKVTNGIKPVFMKVIKL